MMKDAAGFAGCLCSFPSLFPLRLLPSRVSCGVRYQNVCGPTRFNDTGSTVTWVVMSCLYWKTAPLFIGTHLVAFGIREPSFWTAQVGPQKRPGFCRGAFLFGGRERLGGLSRLGDEVEEEAFLLGEGGDAVGGLGARL